MEKLYGFFFKMKTIVLLSVLMFLFHFNYTMGQNHPRGTFKYGKISLIMDKSFITNRDWSEYIHYQKNTFGSNTDNYFNSLPDTIVWKNEYEGGKIPGVLGVDPKYANSPILGLTYLQIKNYCKWRENRLKERYKQNYICRLPNIEELSVFFKKQKTTSSSNILVVIDNEPKIVSYKASANTMEITNYEVDESFFFFCVMEVRK